MEPTKAIPPLQGPHSCYIFRGLWALCFASRRYIHNKPIKIPPYSNTKHHGRIHPDILKTLFFIVMNVQVGANSIGSVLKGRRDNTCISCLSLNGWMYIETAPDGFGWKKSQVNRAYLHWKHVCWINGSNILNILSHTLSVLGCVHIVRLLPAIYTMASPLLDVTTLSANTASSCRRDAELVTQTLHTTPRPSAVGTSTRFRRSRAAWAESKQSWEYIGRDTPKANPSHHGKTD